MGPAFIAAPSSGFCTENEHVRDEETVYRVVERLGGRNGINELTVSFACPSLDVYAVLRDLAERGVVERRGAGVRIVKDSPNLVREPYNPRVRSFLHQKSVHVPENHSSPPSAVILERQREKWQPGSNLRFSTTARTVA